MKFQENEKTEIGSRSPNLCHRALDICVFAYAVLWHSLHLGGSRDNSVLAAIFGTFLLT